MALTATITLALEAAPPVSAPLTGPTLIEGGTQQKVGLSHRNSKQQHTENQICKVKGRRTHCHCKKKAGGDSNLVS